MGHCESYRFGLELETAISKALDEASTYLTPRIVTGENNAVFHGEWDNLNKITTNVTGNNVVNSAAGIMLQEIKPGAVPAKERTLPAYERDTKNKVRSYKVDTPETLPPVTIYNRVGSKFPENSHFTPPPKNEIFEKCLCEYYVWLLCRMRSSNGKQEVPKLGELISSTGVVPQRKTTIDYYTPNTSANNTARNCAIVVRAFRKCRKCCRSTIHYA